jgi:hypothetical protein
MDTPAVGIRTTAKRVQPLKAPTPTDVTDGGISIESRPVESNESKVRKQNRVTDGKGAKQRACS